MSKTWFITGASRGFGREWAIAALERGDRVAATARDTASLDDLVAEVRRRAAADRSSTSPTATADFAAVEQAHEHFGRLDVVVNNAGYGQFGMVEELTEDEARGPDRDQPVRRAVGDPGGAAVPARAGQRPHHPGVLDRRHLGVPARRHLPRVQVGRSRASARRSPRRSPASASTSRWSSPAASPPTGPARRPSTRRSCRRTTRCTRGHAEQRGAARPRNPGDPEATRAAILRGRRRRASRRCGSSSATAPLAIADGGLRVAAGDLERVAGRGTHRPGGRLAGLTARTNARTTARESRRGYGSRGGPPGRPLTSGLARAGAAGIIGCRSTLCWHGTRPGPRRGPRHPPVRAHDAPPRREAAAVERAAHRATTTA